MFNYIHQKKYAKFITLVIKRLTDGQIATKSNTLERLQIIDDLLLKHCQIKRQTSFMQELVVKNKLEIYIDKLNICPKNCQISKSSKILEVPLTLIAKDLDIYLQNFLKEISTQYIYPSPIVLQESHSNFLNGYLNIMELNSLVSLQKPIISNTMNMNFLKTSLASLHITPQNIMENVNTETPVKKIIQCLKIRIYPNNNQKIYINKCLGIYRLVYNESINVINNNKKYNFISVRDSVIKNINVKYLNNNWFNDLYFDSKSLACKEACNAFKSSFAKKEAFTIKYKSKTSKKQNCKIDHRVIKFKSNKLYLFKTKIKDNIYIRNKDVKKIKKIINNSICDSEIFRDDTKAYYLLINYETTSKIISKTIKRLSIDPGLRTYYNCYSKEGHLMKLGNNINSLYKKLVEKADKLASLKTNTTGKRKNNIKRRHKKVNTKIRNIIENIQNHITSFVASSCNEIITSKLDIMGMVRKAKRNINKNIVRDIYIKTPYKLEQKLKHQCNKYNTLLHIVDESYSSLTCSNCKNVKNKKDLKGNRIYDCQNCKIKIDRDYNAAKNIMLIKDNLFN